MYVSLRQCLSQNSKTLSRESLYSNNNSYLHNKYVMNVLSSSSKKKNDAKTFRKSFENRDVI